MPFQRTILSMIAVSLLLGTGYLVPNTFSAALDAAEKGADIVGSELSGHTGLLWRVMSPEIAILMAIFTLALGMAGRISFGFFRTNVIAGATLLPLIAHAIEAAGAWWTPAVIEPVHLLGKIALSELPRDWRVRAELFHAEEFVETAVLIVMISLITTILVKIFWTRKRTQKKEKVASES